MMAALSAAFMLLSYFPYLTYAIPAIAEALIDQLGCGMPERLFMALYTVTQHLERSMKNV